MKLANQGWMWSFWKPLLHVIRSHMFKKSLSEIPLTLECFKALNGISMKIKWWNRVRTRKFLYKESGLILLMQIQMILRNIMSLPQTFQSKTILVFFVDLNLKLSSNVWVWLLRTTWMPNLHSTFSLKDPQKR